MAATSAPSASDQRSARADGSWAAWTAAGMAGIWVAVTVISLGVPDMVTGSEQQHFPVAAASTWLWGLVSTRAFVWAMGELRGNATRQPIWIGLTVATLIVWLVVTILSVSLPVVEAGTDPTRIRIGALVGLMAATALTVLAGITASVLPAVRGDHQPMTTGQEGERYADRPQRDLRRRTGPRSRLLHPGAGLASPHCVYPENSEYAQVMHIDGGVLSLVA